MTELSYKKGGSVKPPHITLCFRAETFITFCGVLKNGLANPAFREYTIPCRGDGRCGRCVDLPQLAGGMRLVAGPAGSFGDGSKGVGT
jgi:hypothetical protein